VTNPITRRVTVGTLPGIPTGTESGRSQPGRLTQRIDGGIGRRLGTGNLGAVPQGVEFHDDPRFLFRNRHIVFHGRLEVNGWSGQKHGDLDNDGSLDLLIVSRDAPLAYFHNKPIPGRQSLTIRLEGGPSNRDGVGALVRVTAGGRVRTAQRFGGGSYLSASDSRLHFGLGPVTKVDRVEVSWPSGRTDTYLELEPDRGYRLREADPEPRPLPGFRRSVNGRK